MFVGHFALALGSKREAPTVSLGWFIAAVTALDLVWPVLLIAGIEKVSVVPGATAFTPLVFDYYPWWHSLLMSLVWGALLAALALARGISRRTAYILVWSSKERGGLRDSRLISAAGAPRNGSDQLRCGLSC